MFTSLSQFKISSKSLGRGTYGDVKLARCVLNDKEYALKIIDKTKLKNPEKLAIDREIQV